MGTTQAKGSAVHLLMDFESSFNTVKSDGSRTPRKINFNSLDLSHDVPLQAPATIRGNRNPTAPFDGNQDVSGSITVPVNHDQFGYFLKALIGTPASPVETAGSDVKTGSPTVTIADGVATFSVAQANAAVGYKVTYDTSKVCYIKAITSTSVFTVIDAQGQKPTAEASPVTVNSIKSVWYWHEFQIDDDASLPSFMLEKYYPDLDVPMYERFTGLKVMDMTLEPNAGGGELTATFNLLGAGYLKSEDKNAGGTITVSSGTATFSTAQTTAAVGDKVYYGTSHCYLKTRYNDTIWDVVTKRSGSTAPADASATTVKAIVRNGDYAGADDIYILSNDRFLNRDVALAYTDGNITTAKSIRLNVTNNLDPDQYCLDQSAIRAGIPEGIAGVSGSANVLLMDDTWLELADDGTEKTLTIKFEDVHGGVTSDTLYLILRETKFDKKSPPVTGPAGIVQELGFQSYYSDGDSISGYTSATLASAIVAQLKNQHPSYA